MYLYSFNQNKKKSRMKMLTLMILVIVVIVAVFILFLEDNKITYSANRITYTAEENETKNYKTQKSDTLSTKIKSVNESVVGISYVLPDAKSLLGIKSVERWGLGTGVIISDKGYILTNQHIAQTKGSKVNVTFYDGKQLKGSVEWTDKNIDLAIIKVQSDTLKVAEIGDSEALQVGETVIAIGNPLGREFMGTSTRGIISGLNRTFLFEDDGVEVFMENLIQTDASINPGNSGGPLINETGEVIGINTIKITEAEGMGFAIPINIVKPLIEKLENTGEIEEAYLGIYAYDRDIIPYTNSKIKIDRGIYICKLDEYGPCVGNDLKIGDIIVSVDGIEVNKMIELRQYIYSKKPGDVIVLHVVDGEEKDVFVKLGRK